MKNLLILFLLICIGCSPVRKSRSLPEDLNFGSGPNTGTGESLRSAMLKIQQLIDEAQRLQLDLIQTTGEEFNVIHNLDPNTVNLGDLAILREGNAAIPPLPAGVPDTVLVLYAGKIYYTATTVSSYPGYYVSNSGDDGDDGLTPATAWQTITKVNASTIASGAVVYFNKGDSWREMLTVSQGVIYDAYGTGADPIINGADVVTTWASEGSNVWSANCPVVTDLGLPYDYVAVNNDTRLTQVGALVDVNATNEYFIDVTPSPDKIYVYSTVDPDTRTMEVSARNFGALIAGKTYIQIKNIYFKYAAYSGIYGYASTSQLAGHSTIDHCIFFYNRIAGIMFDNGYSNNLVQYCTATYNGNGFYSWSDQTYGSDNNVFSHCTSANNISYSVGHITDGHGFGIYNSDDNIVEYCQSTGDTYGINIDPNGNDNSIIIRYNYVTATVNNTPGINVGGNIPAGTLHQVYYNLIKNTGVGSEGYAIWVQGGSRQGTVNIYNNTIFQSSGSNNFFGINCSAANNLNIKNNIVESDGSGTVGVLVLTTGSISTSNIDNNLYYTPNEAGATFYYTGATAATIVQWRTATGAELNSLKTNPVFTTAGSVFTLQSGSPAVNSGVNVGLSSDILGNPIVGNIDMGCYEKQ